LNKGLFSATQTTSVQDLVRSGLRNPVRITVEVTKKQANGKQVTPMELSNFYLICERDKKISELVSFLTHKCRGKKVIIYFITCACVDYFGVILPELKAIRKAGIRIMSLHGKMAAKKRTGTYESFLAADHGVFLCTDVAARGLDIPDVSDIVQFDPQQDPNVFIHRVGRTARMGKKGTAVVFLTPEEEAYVGEFRSTPLYFFLKKISSRLKIVYFNIDF